MTPAPPRIAYFCMEYGLDEAFPIYSGGLGVLAGDFLKAARDLGLPVLAVGLRWERGYCEQRIGPGGHPVDEFPDYDHSFLDDTGVRVRVRIRGEEVACTVWRTERHGHVPLYLLEPVAAGHRWITHRLYEAGTDVRIAQEMLLGIGGQRALHWLGEPVDFYHFNEGHAVFAGLALLAARMETGLAFVEAWAEVRRRIVFTTHTPVEAGNEQHALRDLQRMGAGLELSDAELRAIGGSPFNMTVAGLRLSRRANAVSRLHGETARGMWAGIDHAAPILSITNGAHVSSWQAPAIREAGDDPGALWAAHLGLKRELADEIVRRGGPRLALEAPWIGFARRAARYKRADLLLRDPDQLDRLFAAVSLVVLYAGKAHPDDDHGKGLVARLVAAQSRWPGRVLFLENYDLALARRLTRGCDIWLNTPIRPLEASGTSGMKAAMNGVLNLSILDGWWAEACEHGVNGWRIGDDGVGDDDRDARALYATLTDEVLPAWRDRDRWLAIMRASIRMAVERFSAERMVRDYFAQLYAEDDDGGVPTAGA